MFEMLFMNKVIVKLIQTLIIVNMILYFSYFSLPIMLWLFINVSTKLKPFRNIGLYILVIPF